MSHTPEPWRVYESPDDNMITCDAVKGRYLIYCTMAGGCGDKPLVDENEQKANASRIVACVNACAGVDTETLIAIANGEMNGSEIWELAKVKQQRDELFGALNNIAECIYLADEYADGLGHEADDSIRRHLGYAMEISSKAIAKAGVSNG